MMGRTTLSILLLALAPGATALAADERPCPAARAALDETYAAADAVAQNAGNVVFKLMPAALAAEKAAGEAERGAWPGSIVATFTTIAGEARALAAEPEARTPAAADALRDHARSGEADIGAICGS